MSNELNQLEFHYNFIDDDMHFMDAYIKIHVKRVLF